MPTGLDRGQLPNRDMIFEFTLVPSQQDPSKLAATDIALVYDYAGRARPGRRRPRPRRAAAIRARPRTAIAGTTDGDADPGYRG